MTEKYSEEQKLQRFIGNAVAISEIIEKSDDKNLRSITEKMLNTLVEPSERKEFMEDINNGICFGCGETKLVYTCKNCRSIMACNNCLDAVLKKHIEKCSPLIEEENRNKYINTKITQIVFKEGLSMSCNYLGAHGDHVKERKIFVMYTNYYFKRWTVPAGSDDDIALMTSMACLVSTTVKIAKMALDDENFKIYLRYNNEGGICFSCSNKCKIRCSRCRIVTCSRCQHDKTHRLLCKPLSL